MAFDLPTLPSKEQIAQHSDLLTYAGVMTLSIWGGLVNWFNTKHEGPFSWRDLTAHLLSSSFAGMLTYLAATYAHVPGPLIGVLTGIAAHMGTPALIALAMRLRVVRNVLDNPIGTGTTKGLE